MIQLKAVGLIFLLLSPSMTQIMDAELTQLSEQVSRVEKLFDEGNYDEALPIAEQILKTLEAKFGPKSGNLIRILGDLAAIHQRKRDFDASESLSLRVLRIAETVLGPDDAATLQAFQNASDLYLEKKDYIRAERLAKTALAGWEKKGSQEARVADALQTLVISYRQRGEVPRVVIPILERLLEIRDHMAQHDAPETIAVIDELSTQYLQTREYGKNELLLRRILNVFDKPSGDQARVADILNRLGIVALQ